MFTPIPTNGSRPVTPTLNHDSISTPRSLTTLPSYRPVTTSERPNSRCASPFMSRQRSLEQLYQPGTSPQRSSEDDTVHSSGIHSSGVHSAGDDSDQVRYSSTPTLHRASKDVLST